MDFTPEELSLLVEGLEKKIWSLDHVGISDQHRRKIAFRDLLSKVRAERDSRADLDRDQPRR